MVAIAVSDHGAGIPETDLARIFEPFYRGQHASPRGCTAAASASAWSTASCGTRRPGAGAEHGRAATFTLLIPAAAGSATRAGCARDGVDAAIERPRLGRRGHAS